MRISSKGRYALVAMVSMAQSADNGKHITVISISERFGISKIYLEQVFSLLKRGSLVTSVKGAQGGYQLTRTPQQITAFEILSAIESSLFEETEDTVLENSPAIERAIRQSVFKPLDNAIENALKATTLSDLVNEAEKYSDDQNLMFYI